MCRNNLESLIFSDCNQEIYMLTTCSFYVVFVNIFCFLSCVTRLFDFAKFVNSKRLHSGIQVLSHLDMQITDECVERGTVNSLRDSNTQVLY